MSSTAQYRIVTLSEDAPVRIREEVWPRIAFARVDGTLATYTLSVRIHEDGRSLVYARAKGNREFGNAEDYDDARGVKLDKGDDIRGAIRQIGEEIVSSGAEYLTPDVREMAEDMIRKCLAELPPVDLD